jgi:uncharacterized protein YdgA (DUF945 family)
MSWKIGVVILVIVWCGVCWLIGKFMGFNELDKD